MPRHDSSRPALGIDLGTTFSAMAQWDGRGPKIIVDGMGRFTTRSVVYFDEGSDYYYIGEEAFAAALIEPENGIIGVKRLMDDKTQQIVLGAKTRRAHSPIDISSIILQQMYQGFLSSAPSGAIKPRGVVVTVPYYFRANQRHNTRKAGEKAGLTVLGILDEPVAASLAYALEMVQRDPDAERKETMLVFDLGGGTFDVTVFNLEQTKDRILIHVLGIGGDDRLGGMDFDQCFTDYLIEREGVDLSGLKPQRQKECQQKMLARAMSAKEALAAVKKFKLSIPDVPNRYGEHIDTSVTPEELWGCIKDYFSRLAEIVINTCMLSGVAPRCTVTRSELAEAIGKKGLAGLKDFRVGQNIHRVIRVGGSSKMSFVKELLDALMDSDRVYRAPNPDLTVGEGAAIYAAYLLDPGIMGRELKIINRNPHPFGVEVKGGVFRPLIKGNEQLPAKARKLFSPGEDNATELEIKVYQVDQNKEQEPLKPHDCIGSFRIEGLTPRPRGVTNVWLTFDMNSEGLLQATVEVPEDGIFQAITFETR